MCGDFKGGSGAPALQNPGTRGFLRRSERATLLAVLGVWGVRGSGVGSSKGRPRQVPSPAPPLPGLAGPRERPRQPCPVSCPETRKVVLCRLSSNPYRVREAKCLLGALTSRRAAGTGREDPQPDNNPFQLRFTVKRIFSAKLRGEAESKKAPLRGVGG